MPPSPASRVANWPFVYLAVALTTAAGVLLQLSLSGIFAVVFSYSGALVGMTAAAAGMALGAVLPYRLVPETEDVHFHLGRVSLLNAGVSMAGVLAVTWSGAGLGLWQAALVTLLCGVPFAATGLILAVAVADGVERADRLCGFSLLGAAGACLVSLGLINTIGAPNAAISVSVLFAAAAAVWFSLAGRRLGRVLSVAVGLYFTLLVIANVGAKFVEVRYAKGQPLPGELYSKWNRISRIGVGRDGVLTADGLAIGRLGNGEVGRTELWSGAKTLVIGPGGGQDVARALASDSRDVTVAEPNPILANTIMRGRFAELSGRLYLRPDVHVQVDDGRAFLQRSNEKFEVIQVIRPVAGSWLEGASAPFAAARLTTREAFRDYFRSLTPDGVLGLSGWDAREVAASAGAALRELGEANPELHFRAVSGRSVVIGRQVSPGLNLGMPTLREAEGAMAKVAGGGSTDDHPFSPDAPGVPDGRTALAIGAAVILLVATGGAALTGTGGAGRFLCFFPLAGLGWAASATALTIQFSPLLGRPTYALSAVPFSLLLAGAGGAFASRRRTAESRRRLRIFCAIAAVAIAGLAIFANPALAVTGDWPQPLRLTFAGTLVAPAGVAMGLSFPAALRILGRTHDAQVRWAWALQAAGVLAGTAAALVIAVVFGVGAAVLSTAGYFVLAAIL